MATQRPLKNAPITEAIIDFRVKVPAGFQAEGFRDFKERLRDRYPIIKERRAFEGRFEVKPGQEPLTFTQDRGINGYFFSSQDGRNVVQFRVDGFTFSRLQPYTSWEGVFPEALELWDLYVQTASPEFITRIAVRYINRLSIPLPITDFGQYLTAPPTVPGDLPQAVSSFLTRVVIHEHETGIAANITQALESTVDPKYVTIILDIDAYRTEEFEINDKRVRLMFEKLRTLKNRIFFSSITEDTVRLFE